MLTQGLSRPTMVFDHKAILAGFPKQYPIGHEIGSPNLVRNGTSCLVGAQ